MFSFRLDEALRHLDFHPGAKQEYAAFYDERGQRVGKEYHGREKDVQVKIPANQAGQYDGTWLVHNHVDPTNPRMRALPLPSREDLKGLKDLITHVRLKGLRIISSIGETTLEIKDPSRIPHMTINPGKDPERTLQELEQYFKIKKNWTE